MSLRTLKDVELRKDGVAEATILTIQATQIILEELCAVGKPTDVGSVSLRTGYSEWQIRQVLNSPQYADLIVPLCKAIVAPGLAKSLGKLVSHLDNPDLTLSGNISLNRELRQSWESINAFSPIQDKDERAIAALKALDELREESVKVRKGLVTVEKEPESA